MLERLSQISTKLDYEEFTCFDFVKCIFNLNDTDVQVLQNIPEHKGKTIIELTKTLKKDRSTIHRSLEKLIACNLCHKERQSGEKRGFVDYYYVIPDKEVLKKAEDNLDRCYSKVKKMIQRLENSKEK
jgi:predicted transcriptional regulator